jgi:hypothetical protein
MDFVNMLQVRSGTQVKYIASEVLKRPELLEELWQLFTTGEPPIPQYAAWPIDHIVQKAPSLFIPYTTGLVKLLEAPNHNAVHRTAAKALSLISVPEDLQGLLFDICLNKIMDPNEKPAIQVHCMQTACNIAGDIPELKEELATVIKSGMEYGSAGFRNRGMKLLKLLNS